MKNIIHLEYHNADDLSIERINTAYHNMENKDFPYQAYKSIKEIEEIKIPIIVLFAEKYLANNHSIVIFVVCKTTLYKLAEKLETDCLICPDFSDEDISNNIEEFKNNKKKIMIMTLTSNYGEKFNNFDNIPVIILVGISRIKFSPHQLYWRLCARGTKVLPILKSIFIAKSTEENFCIKLKEYILSNNESFYKLAIHYIGISLIE